MTHSGLIPAEVSSRCRKYIDTLNSTESPMDPVQFLESLSQFGLYLDLRHSKVPDVVWYSQIFFNGKKVGIGSAPKKCTSLNVAADSAARIFFLENTLTDQVLAAIRNSTNSTFTFLQDLDKQQLLSMTFTSELVRNTTRFKLELALHFQGNTVQVEPQFHEELPKAKAEIAYKAVYALAYNKLYI
ncbi:hypothetical protein RCL1_008749 [Eukaryota sp. TZLM3-RCL]